MGSSSGKSECQNAVAISYIPKTLVQSTTLGRRIVAAREMMYFANFSCGFPA